MPERSVVAVFEIGYVGDSLMTLPLMVALRRDHPRARIVRVANAAMEPLWRGCTECDDLVYFDRSAPKLAEGARLLERLRDLRPDVFLNLHAPDGGRAARYYWRDAVFALATGARTRVAFAGGLDAGLATRSAAAATFGRTTMAEDLFRLAAPLVARTTFEQASRLAAYWHDDADRRRAGAQLRAGLADAGLPADSPFLALAPFAKRADKELDATDLGALVAACQTLLGRPTVVLGGPADRPKMVGCAAELRRRKVAFVDLVGQNGFRVAAAILERAGVVLAVDSGLMHLAALVDAPVVALFGPAPLTTWRPFRNERFTAFVGRTAGASNVSRPPFDADRVAAAVAAAAGASPG